MTKNSFDSRLELL